MATSDDALGLGQIIKDTGDFGRFQVLSFVYTAVSLLVLNWSMMTMAFSATIPDFHCLVTPDDYTVIGLYNNLTSLNDTAGYVMGLNDTTLNVCDVNGRACDVIMFDKNMNTVVNQWGLVCGKKWVSQTITTIQMAGLLVGGLFWGHVSDGIGRKPTFFLNVFLLGAFNLVSYFSVNWEMFAAMRFAIGFSCAGFMAASIIFEYIRNKWRVYLSLVPGWAIWSSILSAYCWWLHDWRYIHLAIAGGSVFILLGWFFLPESFRWLVSHGRVEDAEKCIRYVARINRKSTPDLERLRAAIAKEQQASEESKALKIYTVLDLFRTSKVRKISTLFSFIWLFSAYSYYGIAFGVQQLSGNLYLNLFLVSIVDIPGNYLLVLFNTWGGRKWTCVGFYLVGGLFSLAVGIFQNANMGVSGALINAFALTSKLCVSAGWEINTLWSQESFPTVVRYIGGGFIGGVSRVGSMVAPQIITLSLDTSGLLYLVSGVVCILSSAMCVFLDETKNKDLADMLPVSHNHSHRNTDDKLKQ